MTYGLEVQFGLSLCIQGTLSFIFDIFRSNRFIPVHTGNMSESTTYKKSLAVYHCAYREHKDSTYYIRFALGLSLCIQGTLRSTASEENENRFIPVHTGNMEQSLAQGKLLTVYPCAYREHAG